MSVFIPFWKGYMSRYFVKHIKKHVKKLTLLTAVLTLSTSLTGCGFGGHDLTDLIGRIKEGNEDIGTEPETDVLGHLDNSVTTKPGKDDESVTNVPAHEIETDIDTSSEEALLDFIQGDWYLRDTSNGEDYGLLNITSDGNLVYTRLSDSLSAKGSISFEKFSGYMDPSEKDDASDGLTSYEMRFKDISEEFELPDTYYPAPEEDITHGNFYVGRADGDDYLYMSFVGNGDSFIFYEMMQNTDRIDREFDETGDFRLQDGLLLHRDNDGLSKNDLMPAAGRFTAWAWANSDGELYLEPLAKFTYESYEEYTDRHFTAGYFEENDNIAVGRYKLTDDTNTDYVFDREALNSEHPLKMYEVVTDMIGNIKSVEELSFSYYGIYDLGDLPPKLSYSGMTLTYNNSDYDLTEYETLANAIMDVYQVGEWIVVDTHVNPNVGIYFLLNIYTGRIEKNMAGVGLSWENDDLTTAKYSMWDQIYSFKDKIIGTTNDGIVAEYRVNPGDAAMYRYATYLRHPTARTWKAFMDYAPEDAVAFVIENPPEDVKSILPWTVEIGEGSDELYVVSLYQDTEGSFDEGTISYDDGYMNWDPENIIGTFEMDRGEVDGYLLVIPEGIPSTCLHIRANGLMGDFPVEPLSGETSVSAAFITAND